MSESIQTRWVIITGAPSSGKSSLLRALQARGHACSQEAARAYLKKRVSSGISLEEMLTWDYSRLGLEIIEFEEAARAGLPRDERIFLDRVAAIESMAYAEVRGSKTPELLDPWPEKYRHHKQVFLLNPLPLQFDDLRCEDEDQARQLDKAFEKLYKRYGYEVIRVPAYPLDMREPSLERRVYKSILRRVDFILEHLKDDPPPDFPEIKAKAPLPKPAAGPVEFPKMEAKASLPKPAAEPLKFPDLKAKKPLPKPQAEPLPQIETKMPLPEPVAEVVEPPVVKRELPAPAPIVEIAAPPEIKVEPPLPEPVAEAVEPPEIKIEIPAPEPVVEIAAPPPPPPPPPPAPPVEAAKPPNLVKRKRPELVPLKKVVATEPPPAAK